MPLKPQKSCIMRTFGDETERLSALHQCPWRLMSETYKITNYGLAKYNQTEKETDRYAET